MRDAPLKSRSGNFPLNGSVFVTGLTGATFDGAYLVAMRLNPRPSLGTASGRRGTTKGIAAAMIGKSGAYEEGCERGRRRARVSMSARADRECI